MAISSNENRREPLHGGRDRAAGLGAGIDTSKWLTDISRTPEEAEKEYDGISGLYDAEVDARGYQAPHHAGEIVEAIIPNKDAPLLDVGCGTGLLGLELGRRGFSHITGMDISALCLEQARAKGVYTKTIKHNLLERFPFPDGAFALIVCVAVFSRFDEEQIRQIVTEFARVTEERGKILFSHREDLITPALHGVLDGIEGVVVEKVTEPLTYFAEDENYQGVDIRFFLLGKGEKAG